VAHKKEVPVPEKPEPWNLEDEAAVDLDDKETRNKCR
jgi:hypothetical protein